MRINVIDNRLCDQSEHLPESSIKSILVELLMPPTLFPGDIDSRMPIVYHYESYKNEP